LIARDHFINKIRLLGYTFKRQAPRVHLYRRHGSTHYIAVPMKDLLEDEYVAAALRQAGCPEDEVSRFLASSKS
jgi:hypothetical protein